MNPSDILNQLHDFDKASPQFYKHLSDFLRSKEYRSAVPSLQGKDLAWLVEYLDSVLMSISNHASSAFQEYLHELRNICGVNGVLPKSYTLSSSLLSIGLPSVSGSVHEGTFGGSKVRIRRVTMYPNGDPQTFKIAFHRMAVVWKNTVHPNVVPLLGVTTDPIQLISGWMPDVDLTGYIANHPDADRLNLLSDIAESLNYLHFCNVIHGDLRGCPFTPDGHGLVSSSEDNILKYWDVSHLANGHGGRPNSREASKRDALNGEEDFGTREGSSACTMDFIGHKDCVNSAAVSHDGHGWRADRMTAEFSSGTQSLGSSN